MRKFPILILVVVLLYACSKIEKALDLPPDEFSVEVLREPATAFLSWDDASDPSGDTLTFSVELDGRTPIHNISQTRYVITGLEQNQFYRGKVVATNKKGLQRAAEFEITAYQEQLLVSDLYSAIGSYDITGRLSWENRWISVGTPVITNDSVLIVQESDKVSALKLSDGKVIWKKGFGALKYRNPICHDGIVYVEYYNRLYAISTIDGSNIWSIDCNSMRDLAMGNGILYLLNSVGPNRRELKAINPKTGAIKWSTIPASDGILSAMVAKNGVVYLTSTNTMDKPGYLYAYDAITGGVKWRYEFVGTSLQVEESGAPVILNEMIYIPVEQGYALPSKTFIHAVNINNGKLVWQKPMVNIYQLDELAVDTTGVYACGDYAIAKLNPVNGALIWSQSGDFTGNMTLSKDYVFTTVGSRKYVSAYSTTSGDLKRKISGFSNCWYSPVVYKDGQAYYPANSPMSVKH
ncbi:PQQ-binding-like beta-propeller repeat protein [Chitinophaga sedimenti]|uniref:outer membrane protein assembly factor BamB family protein n=1 Tax=Chitinophaga sedimenti TaxID=2033606 RepID=UPI002006443C|nr:PQQ-binding-like beta-propeller repeat protein [Chitinophaga sedimenti]MCK7556537.1 PQQ-binding-like beta-propeller repeat protein [Chitinophaga sedimenti]